MKLAILGGSFDPVHIGHLHLAETALGKLGYDRVILIPAFISPFKSGAETCSPADRLDMLAASIQADPRLGLDDCELRREGVSYTIDTIGDITARYRPTGKPGLILGDDLAQHFSEWRRAEEIVEGADIIIARRLSAAPAAFPYPYKALDNDRIGVSSQEIRSRIREGEDWRYLVPQGARLIIQDRRLYGCGGVPEAAPSWSLIAKVEEAAKTMLSPGRFLHSRNAAVLAWDICRRFGEDGTAAYLAGIAHDICKSRPEVPAEAAGSGGKGGAALHGEAAAGFLAGHFGVEDPEILNAVRYHTTGAAGMGVAAKAVYIADKIEPSRRDVRPELRELDRYADLDSLFEAVLENTVAYLNAKAVELSPGTRRLLEAMRKRRAL